LVARASGGVNPSTQFQISIYLDIRYIEIYIVTMMKHRQRDGDRRHFTSPDDLSGHYSRHYRKHRGHPRGPMADMKHRHRDGYGRPFDSPDDRPDHHHDHHGRRHGRHGRRGSRLFDYGELRFLLLAMIAERPRHGYELIKAVEERFGGSYSPSPGVIYPTLSWLDDMGYARIEAEEAGRKRYCITTEGEAFLAANRAAVDELMARGGQAGAEGPTEVPAPLVRAMQNLKLAMRLRLRRGAIDQTAAETIAAALDAAAQIVERS
jgi:DNA-binding PadR family transcriptional regulator